jgi:hypothetical protein
MITLVYASSTTDQYRTSDLADILRQSRRNNYAAGITGLLLYSEGTFIQALEGDEAAVNKLVDRLHNDPRHTGFLELWRGPIEQRQFAEWAMGSKGVEEFDTQELADTSEILENVRAGRDVGAARVKGLLNTFSHSMR